MPKLIDDIVELEWTKESGKQFGVKGDLWRHDGFTIQLEGGKFALYLESKQVCKGPLKVCKAFALDIVEGRLVKLPSGNYGTPEATVKAAEDRKPLHPIENEPELKPEPAKPTKDKKGKPDATTAKGQAEIINSLEQQAAEEAMAADAFRDKWLDKDVRHPGKDVTGKVVSSNPKSGKVQIKWDGSKVKTWVAVSELELKAKAPPIQKVVETPAKIEAPQTVLGLAEAISLLSREIQVTQLPQGSHFSLDGKFGTFLEAIGGDAKVEWEGKNTTWSGATMVKWSSVLPAKQEAKAPRQAAQQAPPSTNGAPAPAKAPSSRPAPTPKADKSIFGHHVKRVIMAMTVNGFTADEIALVVKAHHIEVSPSRIETVRKFAETGKEGAPASLTPDQIKQLKNIVGKK